MINTDKSKRFLSVYLLAVLFTIMVFSTCYLAYFLGLLNTIAAICMVVLGVFAYEVFNRLSKFRE